MLGKQVSHCGSGYEVCKNKSNVQRLAHDGCVVLVVSPLNISRGIGGGRCRVHVVATRSQYSQSRRSLTERWMMLWSNRRRAWRILPSRWGVAVRICSFSPSTFYLSSCWSPFSHTHSFCHISPFTITQYFQGQLDRFDGWLWRTL